MHSVKQAALWIVIGLASMSSADTFSPISGGMDWSYTNIAAEMFVTYREHRRVLEGMHAWDSGALTLISSNVWAFTADAPTKGADATPVGYDVLSQDNPIQFWRELQYFAENIATCYVDHTLYTETNAVSMTNIFNSDYPQFFSWGTGLLDKAGMALDGFRRARTWKPSVHDWECVTNMMWTTNIVPGVTNNGGYGRIQDGDIIGPWIYDDLQKIYSTYKWTVRRGGSVTNSNDRRLSTDWDGTQTTEAGAQDKATDHIGQQWTEVDDVWPPDAGTRVYRDRSGTATDSGWQTNSSDTVVQFMEVSASYQKSWAEVGSYWDYNTEIDMTTRAASNFVVTPISPDLAANVMFFVLPGTGGLDEDPTNFYHYGLLPDTSLHDTFSATYREYAKGEEEDSIDVTVKDIWPGFDGTTNMLKNLLEYADTNAPSLPGEHDNMILPSVQKGVNVRAADVFTVYEWDWTYEDQPY